jgi:GcrA cell cycle regulator
MENGVNDRDIIGFIPIIIGVPGFITPVFSIGERLQIQDVAGGALVGYTDIVPDERVQMIQPFRFEAEDATLYGFFVEDDEIVFDTGAGLSSFLKLVHPRFSDRKALQRSILNFIARMSPRVASSTKSAFEPIETPKSEMSSKNPAAWSDERVARLKLLWAEGLSASQIAAQLGGVSRNAVIGKIHKLQLPGRGGAARIAPRRPATSYLDRLPSRQGAVVVPISKMLGVHQLSERVCHWPVGDPSTADFHFCGADAPESSPYCVYHQRLAYQPSGSRRTPASVGVDVSEPDVPLLSVFGKVTALRKVG